MIARSLALGYTKRLARFAALAMAGSVLLVGCVVQPVQPQAAQAPAAEGATGVATEEAAGAPGAEAAGVPAAGVEEISGRWAFEFNDSAMYLVLGPDGTYTNGLASWPTGADYGEFEVADGELRFVTANLECADTPEGRYRAFLVDEGGAPELRLELVEDDCELRRTYFAGVTLPQAEEAQ
jgi:hypothetical protein